MEDSLNNQNEPYLYKGLAILVYRMVTGDKNVEPGRLKRFYENNAEEFAMHLAQLNEECINSPEFILAAQNGREYPVSMGSSKDEIKFYPPESWSKAATDYVSMDLQFVPSTFPTVPNKIRLLFTEYFKGTDRRSIEFKIDIGDNGSINDGMPIFRANKGIKMGVDISQTRIVITDGLYEAGDVLSDLLTKSGIKRNNIHR